MVNVILFGFDAWDKIVMVVDDTDDGLGCDFAYLEKTFVFDC